MSVTVVAVLTAKPGLAPQVIEAFREVSPMVHREPGCVLYAAHLEQQGDAVVMVEKWQSLQDLDAHASGAPLAWLNELTEHLLVHPYDVWILDPVAAGDDTKGLIPT